MQDPNSNWVGPLVPRVSPHANQTNFLYADGHVKTARWNQIKWGQLNNFIPEDHPDWSVPVSANTSRDWPGDQ